MAKLLTASRLFLRQLVVAKQWQLPRLLSSGQDHPGAGVPYEHILKDQTTAADTGSVPANADVVVIGGGAVGCATLYHLAKLGMTNAVLIEKDELTAGTTWHTAGLLWQLRTTDTEIKMIAHSRDRMKALEEETGVNPGWIENGGLFIASSRERLDEYKRLHTIGKVFGIESHVLGPADTQKLYPLMNVKDIYGTLYVPGDGTIEPAGYCTALTRAATKTGAKVFTHCMVTDVDTYIDDFGVSRIKGVQTSKGNIRCDAVVNCTGVWAPKIGKMAGVKTPLIPMKHAYVVTERIDGIQNMPNVRDHDSSVYLRLQGDALSVGGYESNPIILDEVADDFAFSLYELDWDVFSQHIEGAVNRVPAIETTGIKSTVCGPESFTPDHKPLMGESPELRGYFHGCGFNSGGLMLSGGCGRELAQWVVQGRPDLDMFSYDIRRFTTELTDNHQWIKERSHEAYSKNYSIIFKHDEPVASRKMKTGPLYQALLDAGCVYEERQAFERPGWFSPDGAAELLPYDYYGAYDVTSHDQYTYMNRLTQDYTFDFPKQHDVIGNECRTCRDKVAVFDMSYFGKFYLTGPDAQAAVDWIFTNDMQKNEGSTMYTCMLSKRGTVEADLTVSRIESGDGAAPHSPQFEGPGFYIAAGGGSSQHSWCHIQSVIQDRKFNCTLQDISGQLAMISVQGPKSRPLLQELTSLNLSNDGFPFSTNKVITLAGERMRALRLSFVGELGWELHIPIEKAEKVYRAIMEAGQKYGIVNAGYRAIDSLSIEKGYRHWHADLRSEDTPLEAALAFTCKLKSSVPFLGREALEKQKEEGMKKRIACFTIDGAKHLLGLEGIYRNGEAVGFLRRSEYAYTLRKNVAYGFIERKDGGKVTVKYIKDGDYEIDCMGERMPATVHTKSPFDPDNKRVQGIYDD